MNDWAVTPARVAPRRSAKTLKKHVVLRCLFQQRFNNSMAINQSTGFAPPAVVPCGAKTSVREVRPLHAFRIK
jgi:hypothetical protein